MNTQHHKQFVKEIQQIGGGQFHLFDMFRDFCELAALSLVNAVDRRQPCTSSERSVTFRSSIVMTGSRTGWLSPTCWRMWSTA